MYHRMNLISSMSKTPSQLCSIHKWETRMLCLMKSHHIQISSMLSQTYMCLNLEATQMGEVFTSKLTLVHAAICYQSTSTNRLQETRQRLTFCTVPLITLWIKWHTTTSKSNNWELVFYVFHVVQIQEMVKFFVVDSRLNPIIGLNDSHELQVVNFNCPIHQSWTGHSCANVRILIAFQRKVHKVTFQRRMLYLVLSPNSGLWTIQSTNTSSKE